MSAHSADCDARTTASDAERAAWKQRWPDHCMDCLGAGGVTYGGSRNEPPSQDGCAGCTEAGCCARCMRLMDVESTDPCPSCGWNWGKEPDDQCPSAWECGGDCAPELSELLP